MERGSNRVAQGGPGHNSVAAVSSVRRERAEILARRRCARCVDPTAATTVLVRNESVTEFVPATFAAIASSTTRMRIELRDLKSVTVLHN